MIVLTCHASKKVLFDLLTRIVFKNRSALFVLKTIHADPFDSLIHPFDSSPQLAEPKCPRCAGDMVKRKALKGANAGNSFWGCSTYPNCRGVLAFEESR
jgi:restriction system protein